MSNALRSASRLGLGTYRWAGTAEHRAALELALDSGCTLIDTAPNYATEEVRGRLGNLLAPRRSELVVISKVGYAPHDTYSLDPAFIRQRITSEAELVGSGFLDVVMVHNPEHLLVTRSVAQACSAIGQAFGVIQEAIERGIVGSFGVSSNVLPVPRGPLGQDAIEFYVDLASQWAARESFTAVQFPFNAGERAALENRWLDRCREFSLSTIANRPLSIKVAWSDSPIRLVSSQRSDESSSAGVLAELVREEPGITWLAECWSHVQSSDALDHVLGLARPLCGRELENLLRSLEDLRRGEIRRAAWESLARPALGQMLRAAGIEPDGAVVPAAISEYLEHVDHVLVGARRTSDVSEVAWLF